MKEKRKLEIGVTASPHTGLLSFTLDIFQFSGNSSLAFQLCVLEESGVVFFASVSWLSSHYIFSLQFANILYNLSHTYKYPLESAGTPLTPNRTHELDEIPSVDSDDLSGFYGEENLIWEGFKKFEMVQVEMEKNLVEAKESKSSTYVFKVIPTASIW